MQINQVFAKIYEIDIELCYFGIVPEFQGKGLGSSLMNWIIEKVIIFPHIN